jgi:hypothetical protein
MIDDTSMIWFALRARRTGLVERTRLKDSSARRYTFVAAMAQFEEQMTAAKVVTPATRPLNLYYGLAQAGMAIAAAHAPGAWSFSRHGLKLIDTQPELSEIQVTPEGEGAFQRVASATGSPIIEAPVTLGKLWASLPDLLDIDLPGPANLVPLNVIPVTFNTSAPRADLYLSLGEMPEDLVEQAKRLNEIFSAYPGAESVKIPATPNSIQPPEKPGQRWRVTVEWPPVEAWFKRTRDEIGSYFDELTPEYQYRGSRFLRPSVEGEGKRPPSCLMTWWLLLYSFSILARYQPRKWMALLDLNTSPTAVALQYVLEQAISVVPHLVLDALDEEPWVLARPVAF